MDVKSLRKTISMLRELLSELDQGEPDAGWRLRRRLAQTIVRTWRTQMDYRKLKAEHPDVHIEFLEPVTEMTATARKLYAEMISVHLAIHRKLKARRELH